MRFPVDAVLRHADAVDEVSERMMQVRSAAGQVVMDSQAYGQICRFLPGLLSPLFGNAAQVMNGAEEALQETALKLRATATRVRESDADGARRLDGAKGSGLELPL